MMLGRQITPHFNEDELRCRCGCGAMQFSDEAVERLEALRMACGFPFTISSGYRCPDHNASVSQTGRTGPHTVTEHDSLAVDILVSGTNAHRLLRLAGDHGFTGIGVAQRGPHGKRFVHLDSVQPGGAHPRPWVWSY